MATQTHGSAAIYCRSSKDRKDVSVDVQRRELKALALSRGLSIAETFADVVESGKDTDRPGFQQLLRALRNPRRGWDHLLVLDTSRLARRRHISIVFEEVECKKHGVRVIYKSVPEADPITEMLLKSILQAMDEWHSLTSREKGLAGMAQNVRDGYRAGGRAPIGYRLRKIDTGIVREGLPVTKSTLELADTAAAAIGAYLRARSNGLPRARAIEHAPGLPRIAKASLVGVEWNALTYAGHTVWNVHSEQQAGKTRRRPRTEWMMQRDTHPGVITDAEAERILKHLEEYSATRPRRTPASYLLTGMLFTPQGRAWHSDGAGYYRVPGKRVARDELEAAIVAQVHSDLQTTDLVRLFAKATRREETPEDPAAALRPQLASITDRISRAVDLAGRLADPGPAVRKLDQLERERVALVEQIRAQERDYQAAMALAQVTDMDIRRRMVELLDDLRDADNREATKDALAALLDRVELDPETTDATLHYRVELNTLDAASGFKVASPRGFEPRSQP
jgi:DNA invertase Pin-like site-specific DNA recombinase